MGRPLQKKYWALRLPRQAWGADTNPEMVTPSFSVSKGLSPEKNSRPSRAYTAEEAWPSPGVKNSSCPSRRQRTETSGRPMAQRRAAWTQAALEQAYKNTAMIGKFPACVLYIGLPNGLVDVNVHPTKAEVKFAREKSVFDGVYYGALAALGKAPIPTPAAEIPAPAPVHAPAPAGSGHSAPKKDFFRSMDAAEFRKTFASPSPVRDDAPYRAERKYPPVPAAKPAPVPAVREAKAPAPEKSPVKEPEKAPEPEQEQAVLHESFRQEPFRFLGETMGVYILVEQADRLILIDKHAAHERILFDKMRLNEKPLMSQELMEPQTLTTDPEGAELIEKNGRLLARLGYELERFGDSAFVLRGVPADVDAAAAAPLLEELVEKLREGRTLNAADVWERLAATVACKAAVKANTPVAEEGLIALAGRVLRGEVTHCPHGRPVMTSFTRAELDKRFGRIV